MTMLRSAPYFPVGDVAQVGRYYQDVLGFGCEYSAGDPPQFAIYGRDDLAVMLRLVADPSKIVPNEAQGGTWDAFFWVNGLTELFREFEERGASIVYPPTYQAAYNMDEFAVRDPSGHVLGFGEERSDQERSMPLTPRRS